MVYADTALEAQAAARAVKVEYEELPHILTIDEAIAVKSYFPHGKFLKKGLAIEEKMADAFAQCDRIFEGMCRLGGQEHFYLETNACLVVPSPAHAYGMARPSPNRRGILLPRTRGGIWNGKELDRRAG